MTIVRDVLERDLSRQIEEIIKLDQRDQQVVFNEIAEYVPTGEIIRQYKELLHAILDGRRDPTEAVGVWVSGFFGSGKSSFAKNLGYMLANEEVLGQPAGELLARRLGDPVLADLIRNVNAQIPTEVIMFDVMLDRAIKRQGQEPLAEIVYTVLLRHLDYAEDFALAELEIELEGEGRLEAFEREIATRFAAQVNMTERTPHEVWQRVRKGASSINRASAALHGLDPSTYPTADSWVQQVIAKPADVTVRLVVERAFALMWRRRPGKALLFVIDEVGQYVGRSDDKIEDLRALVEQFGKEGRNRANARRIPAPAWIVVTSQEKLDEVVANLDSKRVQLARLQDRFKHHVDLSPADIKTVASKRVLDKNERGRAELAALFAQGQGALNSLAQLERTNRRDDVDEAEFIQYYPYLPHLIDLSIDIVSGLRLQAGAPRQIGGSNRTIIKQAYEMLVNERTKFAERPLGDLVTLDLIYDLVEGNLSTEKRKDIGDIATRFPNDPWPRKVAAAIALLEFVRDLPRSDQNIAALLYPRIGAPSTSEDVKRALQALEEGAYIRRTEEGYKLQTQQEKSWETERTSIDPSQKERNDLLRTTLKRIADERIKPYTYRGNRSFRIALSADGITIADGQIPLALRIADDAEEAAELVESAVYDTRIPTHESEIRWIVTLTREIVDTQVDVLRATRMIARYEQVRAQGSANPIELALLNEERNRQQRAEATLERLVGDAIAAGVTVFRGTTKRAGELGSSLEEALRALLDAVVPYLYPKLDLGAKTVKSGDVEEVLKAANLNALPQVYYDGANGLGLVKSDAAGRRTIDTDAEIAREVLRYLQQQHAYGEKVTGRMLENTFTGLRYGWDAEVVRLVLAALLRAGAIEVTHQGRRYRNHLDPLARAPFSGAQAFRSASFAPREVVDLKVLVTAAENLERLTGAEVDVEEEAIASRLKGLAQSELQALLPVDAQLAAHGLPGRDVLAEYRETLQEALDAPSDDCVRLLAGQGKTLLEQRDRARQIREDVQSRLTALLSARYALRELWPHVVHRGPHSNEAGDSAEALRAAFDSGDIFGRSRDLQTWDAAIRCDWAETYAGRHTKRKELYAEAIEELKRRSDWEALGPAADATAEERAHVEQLQAAILYELQRRVCGATTLDDAGRCETCHTTLDQLDSDIAAVDGFKAQALERLWQAIQPAPVDGEPPLQRLRVVDLARGPISGEEDLDDFLQRLRDRVIELLATGGRVVVE